MAFLSRLLDEVDQMTSKFVLQDLRCSKTRQVSTQLCALYSPASGVLLQDVTASAVSEKVAMLKEIASKYNFELLDDCVSKLL